MNKRPSSVTSLLWLVLTLTAWNLLRLGTSISDWNLLAEFAPQPGPIYIAFTASIWTLSGLATWRLIRHRQPRARAAASVLAVGYATWWWADRLLFQRANPNWPFALAATLILLILTAIPLLAPKTIAYFNQRETNEQTSTDQNPA